MEWILYFILKELLIWDKMLKCYYIIYGFLNYLICVITYKIS